jgi:hypothetical protein
MNALSIISPYLQNGNPDTLNYVLPAQLAGGGYPPGDGPYAPGDLGEPFGWNDKQYSVVVCDSGATSATPTGIVAANQLAFWKDKSNKIVTNDRRFAVVYGANASSNFVAGIFRAAIGAGNMCCVLTDGFNIPVKSGANAIVAGGEVNADPTESNGPQIIGNALGTGSGYMLLGFARAVNSGGNTNCDLSIPALLGS